MSYLIDTGVLLRAFDTTSAHYRPIRRAVRHLWDGSEHLLVAVQNIAEFWNVTTRPTANNGLGIVLARAQQRVESIERFCEVVPEDLASYRIWKELLAKFAISGVAAHDARLASVMLAHRIEYIFTLNQRDFLRYEPEGIQIVTPESITAP
jgi:predicted nucleic acid-binding protein